MDNNCDTIRYSFAFDITYIFTYDKVIPLCHSCFPSLQSNIQDNETST